MSALSKPQILAYWRLWKSACESQGWTKENGFTAAQVDAKRKECLSECGVESMKDLDSSLGFSNWKNLCLRLSGSVEGALAEIRKPRTQADKLRWVILNVIVPCLAVYPPENCANAIQWATSYLDVIRKSAIPWRQMNEQCAISVPLEDLTEGDLKKLIATLNSRLSSKRRTAGDSLHDMHIKAKVRCSCAACRKSSTVRADDNEPF